MGRSLSPIVRRELQNLDKDADSRKSAMKTLKSYVKDLDSKAIPLFLAQVSESKENGSSFGVYTISLYEVLARVHGQKIGPQIDNIMGSIIKTLASSAGSFALHQACSKVVPAIARYGIDPTTPEDKKRHVIHSLCRPLSDSLLSSQENLSSGSALCLKALVDCDNWRFASNDMVNEVCQRLSAALEKHNQVNSHLGLVMALAKHNSLIVEAYARLLIHSGLSILSAGAEEGSSQKQFSAIQMINFLMKSLDPKSMFSEMGLIIVGMEKCQSDRMAFVKGAAFEALQTARKIIAEESRFETDVCSVSGSNNSRTEGGCGRNAGDQSPRTESPESQTLNSFAAYDSTIESPTSVNRASCGLIFDRRSVNRKLWNRYDRGGVDVSLKDGLFSEAANDIPAVNYQCDEFLDNQGQGDHADEFAGFLQGRPANGVVRSATPSPQRSRSYINVDNVKIFATPRKLMKSLQDPNNSNQRYSEQPRLFRSPCTCKSEWSPNLKPGRRGRLCKANDETRKKEALSDDFEEFHGSSSQSTIEAASAGADGILMSEEMVSGKNTEETNGDVVQRNGSFHPNSLCALLILIIAFVVGLIWIERENEGGILVPT